MVVANSFTFKFQSTLPRGERLDPFTGAHALTDFNPRSHEGSDVQSSYPFVLTAIFQSTLPRGERRMTY